MRLLVDPIECLGLYGFHALGAHLKSGYFYFFGHQKNRAGTGLVKPKFTPLQMFWSKKGHGAHSVHT